MTPDTEQALPKSKCGLCGWEDFDHEFFRYSAVGIELICLRCVGEKCRKEQHLIRQSYDERQEFTATQKRAILREYAKSDLPAWVTASIHKIPTARIHGWIQKLRAGRLYSDFGQRSPERARAIAARKTELLAKLDEEVQE